MIETRTAKLFQNGASQAVRLPADFRFEGKEVYATRDDQTGDVVLSLHPGAKAWINFFSMVKENDSSDDYMITRPMNATPQETGLFDEVE